MMAITNLGKRMAEKPTYQELQKRINNLMAERSRFAKIEAQLKKGLRFTESLLSAIPTAIFFKDAQGRYQGCNPAFSEIMGVTAQELRGKTVQELWPSEHAEVYHQKDLELMEHPTRQVYEFKVKDKNGTIRPVIFYKNVFLDEHDNVTGLVGGFVDITERKQAEKALKENEDRLQAILEANPDPTVVYDVEGCPQYLNPVFTDIFGWHLDELIGRRIPFVPEDQKEITTAKIKETYSSGKPVSFLTKRLTKKGDTINVFISTAIIKGPEEKAAGMVVNLTDVSEQMKLEAQLQQAQKMESVGRLAGGVAHDLNNLLSPILGYSEMLQNALSPEDVRRESVEQILRAGLRARDLVRQLLAFSRKQTLEYKPVDMNQAVTGFEKLLRRTIREDIEIKIITAPDIRIVMADIAQIEQVIMNLAVNAQDAMPEGGSLTIETATVELDDNYTATHQSVKPGVYIMLAISDTGSGMDDETRKNMFEPFFSTKGEQGTGLGLATVYGIVKQHEGNIWVYSEQDKGSTFKIYLPVSDHALVEEKTSVKRTNKLRGSETIMLVEDDELVRDLAHAILTQNGYTVLAAESGPEALTRLVSYVGPVHLLLTDVVLPGMNGIVLFAKVAKRIPNIKVLYMSGYTGEVIAHRGVLDQGIAFIQKPFTIKDLIVKGPGSAGAGLT